MVQGSNDLLPFDRDKLLLSVFECCKHRNDPLSDAKGLTDTITSLIVSTAKGGLIPVSLITRSTLQVLKNFDIDSATIYGVYHRVDAA